MSAIELINELRRKVVDPETGEATEAGVYDGLSDEDKLAKLNEWHTRWVPCPTSALAEKFAELNLVGRVQVAINKGQLDDRQQAQWFGLKALSKTPKAAVLFNDHPLSIPEFFDAIRDLGVINPTEHTWLLDLGRQQHTIARRVLARDATADDIVKIVELEPVVDKVLARREELARLAEELQAVTNEVQKNEGGVLTGDKDVELPWEKVQAADVQRVR